MKSLFNFATMMAVVVLSGFTAILGTTYNQAVSVSEGQTSVSYYGTVDMTADTTGTWYTQDMYIADMNESAAYIRAVASNVAGTEDVNVTVEFSNDRITWDTVGDVIDNLSTTVKYDTLSTVAGVALAQFKTNRWMRIKFVGQTGNPATTISWYAFLQKNEGASTTGVGRVANRRTA